LTRRELAASASPRSHPSLPTPSALPSSPSPGLCTYEDHDERYKEDYQALSADEKRRYGYERDLIRKLQDLVRQMDRTIEKNQKRADEENAPRPLTPEQQLQLDTMAARVKELVEKSGKLGEEGEVDASLQAAAEADRIRAEREKLENSLRNPVKIMYVCDVCGVYINSTDNEQRKADHYNGKQYLGWKAIRDKLKELEGRERTGEFGGGGGGGGAPGGWGADPSRGRGGEPDRRGRSRSRSRSKSRERSRSRSRDREREWKRERERYERSDRGRYDRYDRDDRRDRYDDRGRGRGYDDRGRRGRW
jgi:RNA-binding protein Luc7-like 2